MLFKSITTRYFIFLTALTILSLDTHAQTIELNGSPFATEGAPIADYITPQHEKVIIVDPTEHAWGAYEANGKLIRWGIATAGADELRDTGKSGRTQPGTFRIYSLGDKNCVSTKFPLPNGGAPMPYCMYFNGSEALHGSSEVAFANISHGCIRIHIDDAEWLRYHFVERPNATNLYRGTKVIIKAY